MNESAWMLRYDDYDPAAEGLREALCTVGNGVIGVRGAACEAAASEIHYPGTYVAGLYNRLTSRVADRDIDNEDFVNCPNWLYLTFCVNAGAWFCPSTARLLSYQQILDMRRGLFIRRMRVEDAEGRRTRVCETRLAHMARPHIVALCYELTPENYQAPLRIRAGIDAGVINANVPRYRDLNSKHWDCPRTGTCGAEGIYWQGKTSQSGIEACQSQRLRLWRQGRRLRAAPAARAMTPECIVQEVDIDAAAGQTLRVEKIVACYDSRGGCSPRQQATAAAAAAPDFSRLLRSHEQAWRRLWQHSDIELRGDVAAQQSVRLHIFHLLQTASSHNRTIDAGMPARGLHGEAYRGHIFWDEAFVLPFYDTRFPDIAQALLRYRFRRLPAARRYAAENGYRGAMFPWQSSADGSEQTQEVHLNPLSGVWGPDASRLQRHVSFAIALNIWRHWQATGDYAFLADYGAELFLSIAVFAASLAVFDPADGRYHTRRVMGPDEFHEKLPAHDQPGLPDNAYTNVMLVWTLWRAAEIRQALRPADRRRVAAAAGYAEGQAAQWDDICGRMFVPFNDDGIIGQFAGYFDLKELDWAAYRRVYKDLHRLDRILKAEGKSPDDYKVAKQADVLMLFYFLTGDEITAIFTRLGYRGDAATVRKNFAYYLSRTSHGSTLSKVVHCYLARQLGRERLFTALFDDVLRSDRYDTQGGTTREGIHCGVMAGSLDCIARGVCGLELSPGLIRLAPRLPAGWQSLRLPLRYRGVVYELDITPRQVRLRQRGGRRRIAWNIQNKPVLPERGKTVCVRLPATGEG